MFNIVTDELLQFFCTEIKIKTTDLSWKTKTKWKQHQMQKFLKFDRDFFSWSMKNHEGSKKLESLKNIAD